MKEKIFFVIILFVFSFAKILFADIYKYTDSDGKTWHVDSGFSVPEEYKNSMEVIVLEQKRQKKSSEENLDSQTRILEYKSEEELLNPKKVPRKRIYEIEVVGDKKFISQIREALTMIKQRAPIAFRLIRRNINKIVSENVLTSVIYEKGGATIRMNEDTADYSPTWRAGAIAHESWHVKLRKRKKEKRPQNFLARTKTELACIKHQLEVLKLLGAPEHEIGYLQASSGTHFDIYRIR